MNGVAAIETLVEAVAVGLIIGTLARLVVPGKQNTGVVLTVVLGIVGYFLDTWISYKLGYSTRTAISRSSRSWWDSLVAVVLTATYLGITGRQHAVMDIE